MTELNPESKGMNRRVFIKKSAKWSFGLMAATTLVGTYSFKVERFWYQIKEVQLKLNNLPKAFEGWKIVQFSDVHLGFHYGAKDLQPVIKMINRLQPDIIFFTGDLVQTLNSVPEPVVPMLQSLKAHRGGKWAITGNHDYMTKSNVIHALQTSQFKVLINSRGVIEANQQRLYIAGIDDVMYGYPNIGEAVKGLTDQDCVLLLAHEPDIANTSIQYPVTAQFSGHSHGGQVRIPLYGPIFKQDLAQKYVDRFYQVGKRKMPLYVNRGIGTTGIAMRFFCRPEITVFHLTS